MGSSLVPVSLVILYLKMDPCIGPTMHALLQSACASDVSVPVR
jgi:hypothetical protein